MDNYKDTPSNPEDTASQILSPIHKQLKDSNLTLTRLCKDLNQVIKTSKDNPNAKLKGIDMGLKLNQAYPAEKHEVTLGQNEMSMAVMVFRREIRDTVPSIEDEDKDEEIDASLERHKPR